jgi:hypothetical protein
VSGFTGKLRMPCHEIRKGLDLTRRFHDANASLARSEFCQSARHGENQISLCNGNNHGHKEWQSSRDTPLRGKLDQHVPILQILAPSKTTSTKWECSTNETDKA